MAKHLSSHLKFYMNILANMNASNLTKWVRHVRAYSMLFQLHADLLYCMSTYFILSLHGNTLLHLSWYGTGLAPATNSWQINLFSIWYKFNCCTLMWIPFDSIPNEHKHRSQSSDKQILIWTYRNHDRRYRQLRSFM